MRFLVSVQSDVHTQAYGHGCTQRVRAHLKAQLSEQPSCVL
jgi:hypothetical protein